MLYVKDTAYLKNFGFEHTAKNTWVNTLNHMVYDKDNECELQIIVNPVNEPQDNRIVVNTYYVACESKEWDDMWEGRPMLERDVDAPLDVLFEMFRAGILTNLPVVSDEKKNKRTA